MPKREQENNKMRTDKNFLKIALVGIITIIICFAIGKIYNIPESKILIPAIIASWIMKQFAKIFLEKHAGLSQIKKGK